MTREKKRSIFRFLARSTDFSSGTRIALMLLGMFFLAASPSRGESQQLIPNLPESMKGATYVGMDTCAACHEKQAKEFKLSTHARTDVKGLEGEASGCEICHGPGSIHVDAGGGRNKSGEEKIVNPSKKPEICFNCHMEKKAEFRLPYRHPVLEGRMSCADCHNLHGPEARPWTTTSMNDTNEVCFKCHKDIRGPYPWEHAALRDGCSSCHKVHGSITDKMLVARDQNLCLRCHMDTALPTIGGQAHASLLPTGTCWSATCHTAPHGSYYGRHLRE